MKKQVIRLTEEDLHEIIKESVNRVLNEGFGSNLALAGMLSLGSPMNANAEAPSAKIYAYEVGRDLLKNSRSGIDNNDIQTFLYNIKEYIDFSSKISTENIKFFGRNELNLQNEFLSKMNKDKTNKYKMFWTEDGMVLMPINYTLEDVKNELFTLNLGNFATFNK
jgi:DNA replication protein DnaD